jgi:DNA-binding transcriptional LysR family regulator
MSLAEGLEFYDHCQVVLEVVSGAMDLRGTDDTGRCARHVDRGLCSAPDRPRLKRFMDANPGVEVQILPSDTPLDLIEHKIDVAFRQHLATAAISSHEPSLQMAHCYAHRPITSKNMAFRSILMICFITAPSQSAIRHCATGPSIAVLNVLKRQSDPPCPALTVKPRTPLRWSAAGLR